MAFRQLACWCFWRFAPFLSLSRFYIQGWAEGAAWALVQGGFFIFSLVMSNGRNRFFFLFFFFFFFKLLQTTSDSLDIKYGALCPLSRYHTPYIMWIVES